MRKFTRKKGGSKLPSYTSTSSGSSLGATLDAAHKLHKKRNAEMLLRNNALAGGKKRRKKRRKGGSVTVPQPPPPTGVATGGSSAAKNMKTGTAVGLQGNADSKFDGVAKSLPKTAKPFYGGRISRKRHKTKRKRRRKKRATRKRRRGSKHRRRSRRRRN